MDPNSEIESWAGVDSWSEHWSSSEYTAIVKETNRILADPAFKGSKRCQALFRSLVEHAVKGDHDGMKERTLGVEVFGREPDYDTSADPVVRMTANEIRKRLAQSYQEPDHGQPVRIRLNAGGYLPKFEFVQQVRSPEAEEGSVADGPSEAIETRPARPEIERAPATSPRSATRNRWVWAAVVLVSALSITGAALHIESTHTKDYLAWAPLLGSTQPLTVCISDAGPLVNQRDDASTRKAVTDMLASRDVVPSGENQKDSFPTIPLVDAEEAQKITIWLMSHGQQPSLKGSSSVDLQDLRQGPVVLIGAFNPWSMILLSNLRYSIQTDPNTQEQWIQDSRDPSNRQWKRSMDHADVDYAIITRLFDQETGRWVLALGGLRPFGTQAATDLLTDRSFVHNLPDGLSSKGNFQIIVKSSIIDGSAAPAQVLAFYSW